MDPRHIIFRLAIDPMPTPRPRARVIAMPGRKPMPVMYSPPEYKAWQTAIRKLLAQQEAPPEPFSMPLDVTLVLTAPRPKTTKLPAPKPDIDNYAKGVLDAITADGRFWVDDTQVVRLAALKQWETPGNIPRPGILVSIRPMPDDFELEL